MNKQKFLILAFAAITLGFSSCSTQRVNAKSLTYDNASQMTRTYDLGSFDRIDLSGVTTIHFVQGAMRSVEARGIANNLDRLKLEVVDGCLYVKNVGKEKTRINEGCELYVTAPKLAAVKVSGVGSFDAKSLEAKHFELNVSGVSDFKVDQLKCGDTRVNISGVGNVCTSVVGDNLYIKSSGVSNSKIQFKGKVADIHNSGVGTTTVDLECDEVKAKNSGQATMILKGHADKTNIDNSGFASIDTRHLNQY